MPATKISSKGKAKRKNVEGDAEAKGSTPKPSKKLRRNNSVSMDTTAKERQPTKSSTAVVVEPSPPTEQEDRVDARDEPAEEEILLEGFSSESDSSDEDLDGQDIPPLDVSKLPSFSKDDSEVQRKLEKAKRRPTEEKGVLYLGRIPHGFYEDEMRAYFSQFGDVTRLRLSRNKKTGRSKHYGFIEFTSSAVAQIVSETMNNYLLMGHILQCKIIPKDQVHPELWVGANKKWRVIPRDRIARLKQNKPRTQEEQQRAELKLLARQTKKREKILAAGIDYDFEAVAYKPRVQEISRSQQVEADRPSSIID